MLNLYVLFNGIGCVVSCVMACGGFWLCVVSQEVSRRVRTSACVCVWVSPTPTPPLRLAHVRLAEGRVPRVWHIVHMCGHFCAARNLGAVCHVCGARMCRFHACHVCGMFSFVSAPRVWCFSPLAQSARFSSVNWSCILCPHMLGQSFVHSSQRREGDQNSEEVFLSRH